jgi:antitoxin component of MazEF toxin-antitoxin module
MKQGKRRIIRHGASVGITIPAKFLRDSQLKVGDELAVVFDDVLFYIKPAEPREKKHEEIR